MGRSEDTTQRTPPAVRTRTRAGREGSSTWAPGNVAAWRAYGAARDGFRGHANVLGRRRTTTFGHCWSKDGGRRERSKGPTLARQKGSSGSAEFHITRPVNLGHCPLCLGGGGDRAHEGMPCHNPGFVYLQSCVNQREPPPTSAVADDSVDHADSPLLASLRAIRTGEKSSHSDRIFTFESEIANEHLAWSSTRVVWSRGSSIHRVLEFTPPADPVLQACFVSFGPVPTPAQPQTLGQNSGAAKERQHLFGVFVESAPPAWQEDRRPIPTLDTRPGKERDRLRTGICVVQRDLLDIYLSDGNQVSIPTPWPVSRVWPADVGLVIERADSSHHQSPFLYSLREPLDEIRPVSGRSLPRATKDRLLFVSSHKEPRIMLTVSNPESALSIWSMVAASFPDRPINNATSSQQHKATSHKPHARVPSSSAQATGANSSTSSGVDLLDAFVAATNSSQPFKKATVSTDRRQSTSRNAEHSMMAREDTLTWDDQARHEAHGEAEIAPEVAVDKLWEGQIDALRSALPFILWLCIPRRLNLLMRMIP
jgi:Anaphase-promoting complex subunit 1